MKAPSNKPDETPAPPSLSTVTLLLRTIGDTTWRMFIPTIGMTILGIILDRHFHTKPWLTVSSLFLGIGMTTLLMRAQYKRVNR